MAEITQAPMTHQGDCPVGRIEPTDDYDPRDGCDCPASDFRCSEDNAIVVVNAITIQTAYCRGKTMHRWRYHANINPVSRSSDPAMGSQWVEIS